MKEVSLQTLSDMLNVPVALVRFQGGGSSELGTLAEPAGATATMMPEHALYRDEMRFTPQSAPAREPIQARTTNTVRPQSGIGSSPKDAGRWARFVV